MCTQAHACANHVCAWVFQNQHAILDDMGLTALVLSVYYLPHVLSSVSSQDTVANACTTPFILHKDTPPTLVCHWPGLTPQPLGSCDSNPAHKFPIYALITCGQIYFPSLFKTHHSWPNHGLRSACTETLKSWGIQKTGFDLPSGLFPITILHRHQLPNSSTWCLQITASTLFVYTNLWVSMHVCC